ncbi:MAG: ribonuclease HII, partial [Pseudomonadota bacterium]
MDLLNLPPTKAFLYAPAHKDPNLHPPDLSVEEELVDLGFTSLCGVDEAGRGPLAGPVVCAAVVLDRDNVPSGLHDSKRLTETARQSLYHDILATSAISVAHAAPNTIDRLNIRNATLHTMAKAVRTLPVVPDAALIDGNALPVKASIPMWPMVKGDGRSASIAAASIVAKTVRDQLMNEAHEFWPHYGFAQHMGYPTAAHRAAL